MARRRLRLLLLVPLLLLPETPPAAATSPAAALERGIIYVQPSYHFASTLLLDMDVLRRDLDAIKAQGFVNVGLRTSWGEIMSKWDGEARLPTWNEASCNKLADIAAECAKRQLRLIFNTHLRDTVPEGVEGARLVNHTAPDSRGVVPAPYWRSTFVDHMVRDSYREPMIAFHTQFAACLKHSPGVPRFWKHAFESAYVFPQKMTNAEIAKTAPAANEKFQRWAQDNNRDIAYWAERWEEGEFLTNFSMVTIPHQTEHPMSKAKFGDFWRFWLLGVLKQGKCLSIGEIYGGLAAGSGASYVPGLAFKHVRNQHNLSMSGKPKNLIGLTDLTTAEVKEAFDLPINATALGYYVNDPASLATQPAAFSNYIKDVKSVAPAALPLIVWETGASTRNMTEAQQARWATLMMQTVAAEGVAGFNWWQYIDWAPIPSQPCGGDTQCQLLHFGAHHLDGSPKQVWSVLKNTALNNIGGTMAAASSDEPRGIGKSVQVVATLETGDLCANAPTQCSAEICDLKPGQVQRLMPGTYYHNRQIFLPAGSAIIGAGINVTHIVACGPPPNYTKFYGCNLRNRRGFLMGDNTYVGNFTFRGRETRRSGCTLGGGMIETPGCIGDYCGIQNRHGLPSGAPLCNPPDRTLEQCVGIINATAEYILLWSFTQDHVGWFPPTMPWGAEQTSGSVDLTLRHITTWGIYADGINFHGGHKRALVEDCELSFSGDDLYAHWPQATFRPGFEHTHDPRDCSDQIIFRRNIGRYPRKLQAGSNKTICETDCYSHTNPCFSLWGSGANTAIIDNHCEEANAPVAMHSMYTNVKNIQMWCNPIAVDGNTYTNPGYCSSEHCQSQGDNRVCPYSGSWPTNGTLGEDAGCNRTSGIMVVDCYLRTHIDSSKCSKSPKFDLYQLADNTTWPRGKPSTVHWKAPEKGISCDVGHGGAAVHGVPEPFAIGIQLEQCELACEQYRNCDGITVTKPYSLATPSHVLPMNFREELWKGLPSVAFPLKMDDDVSKLQRDLNAAIAAGSSTFAISPGVYRPKRDLLLNNARDLSIAPGGGGRVVLLFTCNFGLVLRSCINVSVANVTIDYDPPCYSQGIVTGSEPGSFTYMLDEGFPAPVGESAVSDARFAQAPIVSGIRFDASTQLQLGRIRLPYNFRNGSSQREIKHLGGRSYQLGIGFGGNATIYKGEIVTVVPRAGHTVLLTNSSSCTITGLTVLGSSDMALVEYGGGGAHTWRGNRVVRNTTKRPMGMLASNADVFQSSGCERGPLFESNEIGPAGDDCVNIHNYFSVVLKRDTNDPKRVLLLDGVGAHDIVGDAQYAGAYEDWHQQLNTFSRVVVGDVVRVYDQKQLGLHLTTTVVGRPKESTEHADLVLANQTLADMGLLVQRRDWVGKVRAYWVRLRDEIPNAVLFHAFLNVDRLSSGGAVVRGNNFTGCDCIHFKSIGGTVEDNFMNRTARGPDAPGFGIGILIWPNWLEGSVGLRDVLVARNSFAGCEAADTDLASRCVVVGKGTSNITVIPAGL